MAASEPKPLSNTERIAKLEEGLAGVQAGVADLSQKLDGLAAHTSEQLEAFKAGQTKLIQDTAEYTVSRIKAAGGQPAGAPTGNNAQGLASGILDLFKSLQGQPAASERVTKINEFAERVELSMWKKMARDVDRLFGGGEADHVEISH